MSPGWWLRVKLFGDFYDAVVVVGVEANENDDDVDVDDNDGESRQVAGGVDDATSSHLSANGLRNRIDAANPDAHRC